MFYKNFILKVPVTSLDFKKALFVILQGNKLVNE